MAVKGGDEVVALVGMVVVQVGYAGMNIFSKLAMDEGMNPYVLVSYRQIIATIAIFPLAYFLERKTRPKITTSILFQLFLCSILGATANQVLYFVGLKNTTPTIACALTNLLPAITFLLAVPFRLETLELRKKSGQAKVVGTIVCVGGAMLLSFYHGHIIGLAQSHVHWKLAEGMKKQTLITSNSFLGPFLIITSCVTWAVWFIIQARLSRSFSAPYTSSAVMCLMASVQCVMIAAFDDRRLSSWAPSSGIRVVASLYAGLVGSGLAFCVMSWCIEKKGPLYVSVFSPLLLVIVAVLSWAFLRERVYMGTLVGSLLIVGGLYGVLWGKGKEEEMVVICDEGKEGKEMGMKVDLEIQQ